MIDPPNPSPQLRVEGLLAGRPGQWTISANTRLKSYSGEIAIRTGI